MFESFYTFLDGLLGLNTPGEALTFIHLIGRIAIIYFIGIILIVTQRQFMGVITPFNYILNFTVGSVLAGAVMGEAPFFPVMGMTLFIFLVNFLMGAAIYWSPRIERLIKGKRDLLVEDGHIQWKGMRRNLITKDELMDAVHAAVNHDRLSEIDRAYFENSGRITVIEKKSDRNR